MYVPLLFAFPSPPLCAGNMSHLKNQKASDSEWDGSDTEDPAKRQTKEKNVSAAKVVDYVC